MNEVGYHAVLPFFVHCLPMLNTYCVWILYRVERQRHHGGWGHLFTDVQETAIINMVLANNAIRIWEIREHIMNNDTIFNNINAVSLSTTQHILQRHRVTMKQLYKVSFERNSDKNMRYDFVEVCLQNYFQYFRPYLLICISFCLLQRVLELDTIFNNINAVSLSTIQRILQRHRVTLKKLYNVPFERNSWQSRICDMTL